MNTRKDLLLITAVSFFIGYYSFEIFAFLGSKRTLIGLLFVIISLCSFLSFIQKPKK